MSSFLTLRRIVIASIILSTGATAQELAFKGSHAIEISLGMWGGGKTSNYISTLGVRSEAGTNGFSGSIGYAYWLREHLAVTVNAGVLSAKTSSTVIYTGIRTVFDVSDKTSAVMPILLGLRFYVPAPEAGENIRPFIALGVGSFVGVDSSNAALSQEARTEAGIGGRAGAGIDFFLGNHFKLGASVGYNMMADFADPIGARTNYNGGEFSLVFGVIF